MIMNEKHEKMLKALLSTDVLPEVVVNYYWYVKKLADRQDVPLTPQVLLLIASAEEGVDAKPEPEPEEVSVAVEGIPCDVFVDGRVESGTILENQADVAQGFSLVRLDNETAPREIADTCIKMKE